MNEKQKVIWERARARGIWRFTLPFMLLVGVLPILRSLMSDYFGGEWPFAPDDLWLEKLPYRVVAYLAYLLMGALVGCGIYVYMERRYRKRLGVR